MQDIVSLALVDRQVHAQIHRRDDVQHFLPAAVGAAAEAPREEREARNAGAVRAVRSAVQSEDELQNCVQHRFALAQTRGRRAREQRVEAVEAPAGEI